MNTKAEAWPRLSADLAGPRSPDRCQSCGATEPLDVWREHDDTDRPGRTVVVLCRPCADRLIDRHPRLYSRQPPHSPIPGVMPLCLDCIHRDGVRCGNPRSLANGGSGLHLTCPKPTRFHVLRRGKAARSGWETVYRGPVKSCEGKEVATAGETK